MLPSGIVKICRQKEYAGRVDTRETRLRRPQGAHGYGNRQSVQFERHREVRTVPTTRGQVRPDQLHRLQELAPYSPSRDYTVFVQFP